MEIMTLRNIGLLSLLVFFLTACSSQPNKEASVNQVDSKYDEFTIDERLNNIVFRVNSLERGIYLIQKAVREADEWGDKKKRSVCIAAGKTVRQENIDSMKAIIVSLEDEQQAMNEDQLSAYHEYRRRIWAFKPEQPLC